jgi:hypothetical protein
VTGNNRIMIYGPKETAPSGRIQTAEDDVLAISVPKTEAHIKALEAKARQIAKTLGVDHKTIGPWRVKAASSGSRLRRRCGTLSGSGVRAAATASSASASLLDITLLNRIDLFVRKRI